MRIGRSLAVVGVLATALPAIAPGQDTTGVRPATSTGAIAGRVIDQTTNAPVPQTIVDLVGTPTATATDESGRFRLANLAPGVYRVRVRRLGYQPVVADSVRVVSNETTTRDFAFVTAATKLEAVSVTGAAGNASDAAMMEQQRTSATVLDGISAQAISRAPGSNAADAISRVTGISVVDKKFAVVRGLPERYNNTLLNGVELPSPEPLRKIVPLDVFPSSLLEGIVASKTSTPDMPGDFAGGSVEIRTKDFPDSRVVQVNVSQDWSELSTFRPVGFIAPRGSLWMGFGGAERRAPTLPPPAEPTPEWRDAAERFAESLRNVWTPTPRKAPPGLGFGVSLGDRLGGGSPNARAFGYTLSLSYSNRVSLTPERLYQLVGAGSDTTVDRGFLARESQFTVDWGAVANFALQLRPTQTISLKNLYTRNAEEFVGVNESFSGDGRSSWGRTYQVRYIERDLIQTQLSGSHLLGPLFGSRLEWKGTFAHADRDEPDNRSIAYTKSDETGVYALSATSPGFAYFRFLDDDVMTGQIDWTLPLGSVSGREFKLKTGGLTRRKERNFRASVATYSPTSPVDGEADVLALPPEQAFAPEHVGGATADIVVNRIDALALPYKSRDDVNAGYLMADAPLFGWFRLVGGARLEQWRLDVQPTSGRASIDSATKRRETDILGSLNVTVSFNDRLSLRLAGYQTLTRPDPRELANDYYAAVAGECANQGNDKLRHTRTLNGDARLELYPGGGELIALSGFHKQFENPVIESVGFPSSSTCVFNYLNAESALVYGGEFEIRKSLDFLPLIPDGFSGGVNLTLVETEAKLGEVFDHLTAPFMGQSPYVGNGSIAWVSPRERFNASVLVNAYGERISRYGGLIRDSVVTQIPHVKERKRTTVDAKVQFKITKRFTASLSARNLLDAPTRFYQQGKSGVAVTTGYSRSGASAKIGAGYEW